MSSLNIANIPQVIATIKRQLRQGLPNYHSVLKQVDDIPQHRVTAQILQRGCYVIHSVFPRQIAEE